MAQELKISLRAVRVNAGYTQKEAANLLGISEPTLIAYEKGKTSPTVDVAKKMGELYDFPYENIIFRKK